MKELRFRTKQQVTWATKALVVGGLLVSAVPNSALAEIKISDNSVLNASGYLRTAAGTSKDGEDLVSFALPGLPKYRLGNEADSYYEVAFSYKHYFEEIDDTAPAIEVVVMPSGHAPAGEEGSLSVHSIAQWYVNSSNMLADGVDVWIGKRYYDRFDTHINDHFWLNSGQGNMGAGIEGIPFAGGEIKAAIIQLEDTQTISGVSDKVNSYSVDLRWESEVGAGNKFGLWTSSVQRTKSEALGLNSQGGFGVGAWYASSIMGGSNRLGVLYRSGAAVNQGDFNYNPVREYDTSGNRHYDLDDANSLEVNNNYLWENDDFSINWVAGYRKIENGMDSDNTWISTGIRPMYYISDRVNVALELGIDHLDDEATGKSGSLKKATLALQLAKGRGFYTRPVLRAFVTHAQWDKDFQGDVGGTVYAEDTSGTTVGLQAEYWF